MNMRLTQAPIDTMCANALRFLAIDAVDFLRKADAEVASPQRPQRGDKLAAVDKIAGCLDVHSALRRQNLPRPG